MLRNMAHQEGKMLRNTDCAVEGCEKPPTRRGWCQAHYMQWYRQQQKRKQGPGTYDDGYADGVTEGCNQTVEAITQMLRHHQGSCWLEGDKVCLEIQGHRFQATLQ